MGRANLVLTFPFATLFPTAKEHKVDVPSLCQLKAEFGISTYHTAIIDCCDYRGCVMLAGGERFLA